MAAAGALARGLRTCLLRQAPSLAAARVAQQFEASPAASTSLRCVEAWQRGRAAAPWNPRGRGFSAQAEVAPHGGELQLTEPCIEARGPPAPARAPPPPAPRAAALGAANSPALVCSAPLQRLKQLRVEAPGSPLSLRITVEGGGCSGFQYRFDIDTAEPRPDDRRALLGGDVRRRLRLPARPAFARRLRPRAWARPAV